MLLPAIGTQNLVYSSHTFNMCTTTADGSGYGEVTNVGTSENPVWVCKFDGATCPTAQGGQPQWTNYYNYSTTSAKSYAGIAGGAGCTTGSHAFSNVVQETCTYYQNFCNGCCGGDYCTCDCYGSASNTGYATITQVGCY